ncbi:MAG: acyloxyacyl hydrolase [Flavobacteriales bacterium]|nr:acyloxyacyl hydrolase [Flavobacteriales bacterium]
MLRKLFLSIFVCSTLVLNAQKDSTRQYNIGFNTGYGFVLPHSPVINFLANRHISQNEIYIEQQSFGKKAWQNRYSLPSIGILISKFDLKNKKHIGQTYTFSPYLKFRLTKGNRFNLQFRPSIGLGYIEKPFEEDNNFKNSAIGSYINMFISISINGNLKLHKYLSLNAALNLSHLSNTGFKTPNLGFNMLSASTGIKYSIGRTNAIRRFAEEKLEAQKAYWQINTSVGLNEINPPNGKKYLAKALFLSRERKLNHKSTIGAGIDIFYNPAQRALLRQDSTFIGKGDNVQIALSVSHILHFGRLSFTGQISYYLKTENKELGNIYHVFGGRWAINERYNILFLGKTHIDKAEYVMIGFGLKLGHEK